MKRFIIYVAFAVLPAAALAAGDVDRPLWAEVLILVLSLVLIYLVIVGAVHVTNRKTLNAMKEAEESSWEIAKQLQRIADALEKQSERDR